MVRKVRFGALTPLTNKFRYLLYCLIGVLVLARDIGGMGINRFLFISIAAVICVLSDCNELSCLAAFVASMHTGISGTFIVLLIFFAYFLKKPLLKLRYEEVGAILMVLLLELVNSFRGEFSLSEYFRFSAYFILVFFIILDRGKNCDGERVLRYFIAGFLIALLSIWGQMLGQYSLSEILALGIRFGSMNAYVGDTMRVSFNPNDLGFVCVIVAVLSLLLRKRHQSARYYFTFLVSVLTGIMTMSRGAMLTLSIGLVLYFLFTGTNLKRAVMNIMFIVIGVTAVVFLVNRFIPSYFAGLIARFARNDLLNGRDTIMMYYNEELMSHADRLLFGVGLQNYAAKYGFYMSAHNATQEIIIAWGLVGFASILFLFVRGIKVARILNHSISKELYIPLIVLVIGLQSGQGFSQYSHMLYFLVAYCTLYMEAENAGKIQNSQHN